jgi:hypothetical protein
MATSLPQHPPIISAAELSTAVTASRVVLAWPVAFGLKPAAFSSVTIRNVIGCLPLELLKHSEITSSPMRAHWITD